MFVLDPNLILGKEGAHLASVVFGEVCSVMRWRWLEFTQVGWLQWVKLYYGFAVPRYIETAKYKTHISQVITLDTCLSITKGY